MQRLSFSAYGQSKNIIILTNKHAGDLINIYFKFTLIPGSSRNINLLRRDSIRQNHISGMSKYKIRIFLFYISVLYFILIFDIDKLRRIMYNLSTSRINFITLNSKKHILKLRRR